MNIFGYHVNVYKQNKGFRYLAYLPIVYDEGLLDGLTYHCLGLYICSICWYKVD
jgi:hypothetical protein